MANLNKVLLIGRLTREPEARTFSNGGKVVNFGFACNNRRKNSQTGQWEDEPVFIDCKAFNRGESGLADRIEQTLQKGSQIFIEGHLTFESWDDKNSGQRRSKLAVIVDNFQYLDPKREDRRPMSEPDESPAEIALPSADIPFSVGPLMPFIGATVAAFGVILGC